MNKQVNTGPNLDRQKVLQLPDHLGPARPSVVLQQAVQGCIDSAFQQKSVFTLLTEGYGGEKISGLFANACLHSDSHSACIGVIYFICTNVVKLV